MQYAHENDLWLKTRFIYVLFLLASSSCSPADVDKFLNTLESRLENL